MAQTSVTDFFKTQKRNVDFHPSKRRKLDSAQPTANVLLKESIITPPVSRRTRARTTDKNSVKLPTVALKSTKGRKTRKVQVDKLQPGISDSFANTESSQKEPGTPLEETTAACDDHCSSPPGTPKKRNVDTESEQVTQKRSRQSNAVRKDLLKEFEDGVKTPEKAYDFTRFQGDSEKTEKTVRKKLILKSPSKISKSELTEPDSAKVFQFCGKSVSTLFVVDILSLHQLSADTTVYKGNVHIFVMVEDIELMTTESRKLSSSKNKTCNVLVSILFIDKKLRAHTYYLI